MKTVYIYLDYEMISDGHEKLIHDRKGMGVGSIKQRGGR